MRQCFHLVRFEERTVDSGFASESLDSSPSGMNRVLCSLQEVLLGHVALLVNQFRVEPQGLVSRELLSQRGEPLSLLCQGFSSFFKVQQLFGVVDELRNKGPLLFVERCDRCSVNEALKECYIAGTFKDAQLAGTVNVAFTIEPTGRVSSAQDAGSDMPDPDVVECVVGVFAGLEFPPGGAGATDVTYPVSFGQRG